MNLVLDFGNTRIKAGLFKENALIEKHIFDSAEQLTASSIFKNVDHCLLATVTGQHENILYQLEKKCPLILFRADTPVPVKNMYQSALTLGSDRLAASVGAWTLYPRQDVLTIDAGTCIKYNFLNSNDEYMGGAISPGIHMRLKAMNHYTQRLPLIEADHNFEKLIGQTTAESILSGAINGAAAEADEMISRYRALYPRLVALITGGDADYLCRRLKNRFFANQNLLLSGLNTILNFNLEK